MDFGLYTFERKTFSDTELIEKLGIDGLLKEDGTIDGNGPEELRFASDVTLTLPKDYDEAQLKAEVTAAAPGETVEKDPDGVIKNEGRKLADVKLTYLDRPVGDGEILDVHDPTLDIEAVAEKEHVEKVEEETSGTGKKVALWVCLAIGALVVIFAVSFVLLRRKREKERRERLRRRRRERLREINVSEEEFGSLMKDIRSGKKTEE